MDAVAFCDARAERGDIEIQTEGGFENSRDDAYTEYGKIIWYAMLPCIFDHLHGKTSSSIAIYMSLLITLAPLKHILHVRRYLLVGPIRAGECGSRLLFPLVKSIAGGTVHWSDPM